MGHKLRLDDIFYTWGGVAYSYFDGTLNPDQLYTSIQTAPLSHIWVFKKKTRDELSGLCFLIGSLSTVEHISLRNQAISDGESIKSLASMLDIAPRLRFIDLSNPSAVLHPE